MSLSFSIITPSFHQLSWLKLNSASVQDQEGVDLEHIIQDADSSNELHNWAVSRPRTALFVEKDDGMFDAINRGWRRARGDIIAQLNCDEQYLPGALLAVARFFLSHPDVDIVYSDSLVMDAEGNLTTYWKAIPLSSLQVAAIGISNLTAGIFFRRNLLEEGFYYNTRWRCIGDQEWSFSTLGAGKTAAVLNNPTSLYTVTGTNLSRTQRAAVENRQWQQELPLWVRGAWLPFTLIKALRRKVLEPRTRLLNNVKFYLPNRPESRYTVQSIKVSTSWPLHLYM